MATSYTTSGNIASLKLKGWLSSASSLSDPDLCSLIEDALRSFVVPFVKRTRDEWFESGGSTLTPNAAGRLRIPPSVGSTVRTVSWLNNGVYVPLDRIEPENALPLLNQGAGQPIGFVLRGYELQVVPANVGSVQLYIEFMERPATLVLDEDAGRIESHASLVLTLEDVPLAWQSAAPTEVDIISSESPFSAVAESVEVVSLVGSVLTLTGIDAADIEDGFWVTEVGTSPFPNIPIELHPLLQRSVVTELYGGTGDKRLKASMELQTKMENELRATIAPRSQGTSRPIVNRNGPGWGFGWRR